MELETIDAYEEVTKELIELRGSINSTLQELKEVLYKATLVSAQVYKIPLTPIGEEQREINTINIDRAEGFKAFYLALNSYSDIYAKDGVSRKSVFRLPGYIQIDSQNNEDIVLLVNKLNLNKELFKKTVQKINGARKRHEIVHNVCPGVITKQLYRKIHVLEQEVSYIGFFWTQRYVTKRTTSRGVIEVLENQMKKPPVNSSREQWEEFLTEEISNIKALPKDIELRYKRVAKVNAMANIEASNKLQLSAHLPLIVLQKKSFRYSPLKNYDADFKRCVRSDSKTFGMPIISRLNLYKKINP